MCIKPRSCLRKARPSEKRYLSSIPIPFHPRKIRCDCTLDAWCYRSVINTCWKRKRCDEKGITNKISLWNRKATASNEMEQTWYMQRSERSSMALPQEQQGSHQSDETMHELLCSNQRDSGTERVSTLITRVAQQLDRIVTRLSPLRWQWIFLLNLPVL